MSALDSSSPKTRLISAEAISPEQSKWVNELVKISGARGVIVGALVESDSRDIRPLLLTGGKTWLLRSLRSATQNSSGKQLSDYYQRLSAAQLISKDVFWGFSEGVFWVRRSFYQGPLDLRLVEGQRAYTEEAVQRLVRIVRDIHRADLAHGHICSANVVFNAESPDWPLLVDYGFSLGARNIDPLSLTTSRADDVAGLAKVLELMLASDAQAQYNSLLNKMCESEGIKRPTMNEVAQAFLPGSNVVGSNIIGSQTKAISSGAVKAGRVIVGSEPMIPKAERMADGNSDSGTLDPQSNAKQSLPKVSKERARQQETPEIESHFPIPNPGKSESTFLGPLIILLVAIFGVFLYQRWHSGQLVEMPATDRFAEYWSSNQRSLMTQVADSAVFDNDRTARMIIASDALKGVDHIGVQSRLIRVAFNDTWEKDLSETDRQIVMGLALAGLVSEPPTDLPALDKANPAVAFALAASLPLDSKAESLASISVSSMARMTEPYGSAFNTLVSTGVKTMREPPARALAHILAGEASPEAIDHYLDGAGSADQELSRLNVIMPLSKVSTVADTLWSVLGKRPKGVGRAVHWFEEDQLQHWDKVSKEQKLGLAIGKSKLDGLQFDQIADLLTSPLIPVRQAAVTELGSAKVFGDAMAPTLKFISSGNHKLTRNQIVALLSSLKLEGESQFAYIAKWFGTSPDPESVLRLVLARRNIVALDPFNVEATRYLHKKPFKAAIADYKVMINHPEPLVRSLAYSKLNPANPAEAELLRDMAKMEPSDKRRQLIEEKLSSAGAATKGAN